MDFGALPPEINSSRMYAGPGSGPLLTAAVAWDGLAPDLYSTAASYRAVISALTSDVWSGPSSTSMAAAAATYTAWLNGTAGQAEDAAMHARLAAAAYETAFVLTVPPPEIAANRSLLAALVATNFLGQNTPAITATEAQYAEMWAQDAAAMYGYAASSASASQADTVHPASTDHQRRRIGRAIRRRRPGRRRSARSDRDTSGPATDLGAAERAAGPRITGVLVAGGPIEQLGSVHRTRGRGHRHHRRRRRSAEQCAGYRRRGCGGLGAVVRCRRGCRIRAGGDGRDQFRGRGARGPDRARCKRADKPGQGGCGRCLVGAAQLDHGHALGAARGRSGHHGGRRTDMGGHAASHVERAADGATERGRFSRRCQQVGGRARPPKGCSRKPLAQKRFVNNCVLEKLSGRKTSWMVSPNQQRG